MNNTENVKTSIAPWLSVSSSARAVEFYMAAFGAIENYRVEDPDGNAVVRLSVNGSEFWLSDTPAENAGAEMLGGGTVRMILTVANPEVLFEQAVKAGATEIFPVSEAHGWKSGRLVDPFGLHWEIGRPVSKK